MSQIKILDTELENTNYKTEFGIEDFNTTDKVYLPSHKDFYDEKENRDLVATDYAIMCGADLFENRDYGNVLDAVGHKSKYLGKKLLRTASIEPQKVDTVEKRKDFVATPKDEQSGLIFPALRVDVSSFKALGFDANIVFSLDCYQQVVTIGLNFPRTFVGKDLNVRLNSLYQNGKLIKTGAKYSGYMGPVGKFYKNEEYLYGEDRYVKTDIRTSIYNGDKTYLSDWSRCPESGTTAWVRVEPIKFIIKNWDDLPTDINPKGNGSANFLDLESEEGILSGMPENPYVGGFARSKLVYFWQNSSFRAWLNGYNLHSQIDKGNGNKAYKIDLNYDYRGMGFLDEATQTISKPTATYTVENQSEDKNPYDFTFSNLSNDELLKEYIKARAPVFLHGVSGVGKSSRVKEIDPDATRITLRPGMNAEEVDGTLDRETGKYIPPLWYQQLCEKCKKEPDKMHILFIDEITNVKPTVQSLIYSIVLERAGKDGLWPLPENCVVVGAGNETAGNLSAYPLTNALFRRFCHIYYDVDKNEWLKWATGVEKVGRQDYKQENIVDSNNQKRARIHPAIVEYIDCKGDDVLYKENDEEEPEIVTDPRKWEIASKILYSTQNPKALVPAIGNPIATDFIDFVSSAKLTVQDIISKNFNEKEVKEYTVSETLSTIAGLTNANEKELPIVRDFVSQYFGSEVLAKFDALWIRNDPERALTINNLENYIKEK